MSFTKNLSPKDLERLRQIVKKEHLNNYPAEMINNYQADKIIDAIAPETAGNLIRMAVDSGFVE